MNAQEALLAETEVFRSSLYHFAKYCLGYSELNVHVHKPICDGLQDPHSKRKLMAIPRGCFKSSMGSIAYPIWLLIHNPNLRIMIDSELYSNSKNFLRELKGHLKLNQKFRTHFPGYDLDIDNEGEIVLANRTKVLKEATILCSGIGAQKTGNHLDVIIGDDLSSTTNTRNPELAQKTIDHYRLYTSLLEPNGTIVIIGTRYSELDIIGYVLSNELGIEVQDAIKLSGTYVEPRIIG